MDVELEKKRSELRFLEACALTLVVNGVAIHPMDYKQMVEKRDALRAEIAEMEGKAGKICDGCGQVIQKDEEHLHNFCYPGQP